MDVLVVSPEIAPYARETRAGDFTQGLSKTLVQMGHSVTVAAPRYRAFEEKGLLVARRLTPLELEGDGPVTVFDGQLSTGVQVVLFDYEDLYARPGVYSPDGGAQADDAMRFGVLCRAAVALCLQREERETAFDAIHVVGYPAAPVALLARQAKIDTPVVLTLTSPTDRGDFPLGKASALGLTKDSREEAVVSRKLSFLAAGIRTARVVTVPSPTWASDIVEGRWSGNRLLPECADRLVGVAEGLDYSVENPATDVAVKSRFDAEDVHNKGICKTDVVRSLKLELDVARPLLAVIVDGDDDARRVEGLLAPLQKMDVNVVIWGAAAPGVEVPNDASEHIQTLSDPSDAAKRRVLSGADVALLPAQYATHAHDTRVAQRYGAVPVAVAAGAQLDAIVDCDAALRTGTGFLASDASQPALVSALQRALAAYASDRWTVLRRRVMRQDLSWDRPGRRYVQLYRQARTEPLASAG